MGTVIRRNKCPKCSEVYDSSRTVCPSCKVPCEPLRNEEGRSQNDDMSEEELDDAERTFLSKTRRYKGNDGKIDQEERNELVDLALALGLSPVQREKFLERAECEYERETSKLLRGDSSDGIDRRFAFLDWRRWRKGPLRYVRSFVGKIRNRLSNVAIERPTTGRAFGGVCAGIGKRFGMNCMFLRMLSLAGVIVFPAFIAIYFVFWSVMPNEGEHFIE